ncbi:hypothetical protein L873DRAFT_798962 [Choiromyces venosus 120613-1]|uniref:Uncharacterized protein n=1 Tax=Choiromyces venosus 120613-1 TaxID=1336337 RepID=A0A3N4K828_9PEZI|nr:hypothetical protein L873DRAFT_798962 [Choiromyces venosus 120613-1]
MPKSVVVSMGLKLKIFLCNVYRVFQGLLKSLLDSPRRNKRAIKVSLSLTMAVALSLPPLFASFHGTNPFLLGTVAIYLFPLKTIGGQLASTGVGLMGVMYGLGYANLTLLLARLIQSTNAHNIGVGRRALLWSALVFLAIGCGYVRSKYPRAYLATNFIMVVNMFALIRGINHFEACFHNFFFVMVFGACVSLAVCFFLWPEDHSSMLRDDVITGLREAHNVMQSVQHAMKFSFGQEVDITAFKESHVKISAALEEANYELSLTRVDSAVFVPLNASMARMLSLTRAFNSAMRRRHRLYTRIHFRFEDLADRELDISTVTSSYNGAESNSMNSKQALELAFASVCELFDGMTLRVEELYRGREIVSTIEYEKFASKIDDIHEKLAAEVELRKISGPHELEGAAFMDQVNTVLLDMLEAVKDTARIIGCIEKRRISLVLPRKLYTQESSIEEDDSTRRAVSEGDHGLVLLLESTSALDRFRIFLADRLLAFRSSRHIKYGTKFAVVVGLISLPAYISDWHVWYENLHVQWALISAMVVMETTRGMTFRTAGMKLAGAIMGGLAAFLVMQLGQGVVYVSIALTSLVGLGVGFLVQHPKFSKAGTVLALAYNIILGVATIFPGHATISSAFARRILTLPVGVVIAMSVHLTLFPFRSRSALAKALSHSLDWLHHLVFAIEASGEFPKLRERFDDMARKARRRVTFAKILLPATVYEVSLAGHWPYERFKRILEKVVDVMSLVIGENEAEPAMSKFSGEKLRLKLLASLCNDLLVISHTLSARLFMPRNESLSTYVLDEYLTHLAAKIADGDPSCSRRRRGNFADLGRLTDLVCEMNLLREEVDELIAETQCPKKGLLPHLSFVIKKSRPSTPVGDEEAGGQRRLR